MGNPKKALEWYREAVSADSAQVDNIITLAVFLQDLHTAHEPEQWYHKALKLNPTEPQKGIILSHLGSFYTATDRGEAETTLLQAKQIQERLVEKNPAQYEPSLASTLSNLAGFHSQNNRRKEAESAFLQVKRINERLRSR